MEDVAKLQVTISTKDGRTVEAETPGAATLNMALTDLALRLPSLYSRNGIDAADVVSVIIVAI